MKIWVGVYVYTHIHTHTGILVSHKKEQNCIIVDFPFYGRYHLPCVLRYFYVGYVHVYDCSVFFLDESLDHYVVSFLVSCDSL
jgi:hypothetical protein